MRFFAYKDGRFIGGIECGAKTRDYLRDKGYTLLPA